MKKKLLFIGILMLVGMNSQATQLHCDLYVLSAGVSGIYPEEKDVKLNATALQASSNGLDLKKCSTTVVKDQKIQLCAYEDDEAVGVYHAEMLIENLDAEKDSLEFSTADALFALPKKGNVLAYLDGKTGLAPAFAKKMNEAELDYPNYTGGDSLQIDEAVEKGVAQKVIRTGSAVAFRLSECSLKN